MSVAGPTLVSRNDACDPERGVENGTAASDETGVTGKLSDGKAVETFQSMKIVPAWTHETEIHRKLAADLTHLLRLHTPLA